MQRQERPQKTTKIFSLTAAAATAYLATEIVLRIYGRSICGTDACNAVSALTRFGDIPILVAGLLAFAVVAAASSRLATTTSRAASAATDITLTSAMATEGMLITYQYAQTKTFCTFCLTVMGIWTVLTILRMSRDWPSQTGRMLPATAIMAALATATTIYLATPPDTKPGGIHQGAPITFFYAPGCSHCARTMQAMDGAKIAYEKQPYAHYRQQLATFGITKVPTLLLADGERKTFITGENSITQYINAMKQREPLPNAPTLQDAIFQPHQSHPFARRTNTGRQNDACGETAADACQ